MQSLKKRLSTAPNLISLSRFIFAPVVFALILTSHMYSAFVFYVIGALTDALDGYVARKLRKTTNIGSFLDALADRIFAVIVVIALLVTHRLTLFTELLFLFWIFGEAIIGVLLTRKMHKFYLSEIHRNSIRLAAVFTFSTIGAVVLGIPLIYIDILAVLSLAICVYSFFDYLVFIFKK